MVRNCTIHRAPKIRAAHRLPGLALLRLVHVGDADRRQHGLDLRAGAGAVGLSGRGNRLFADDLVDAAARRLARHAERRDGHHDRLGHRGRATGDDLQHDPLSTVAADVAGLARTIFPPLRMDRRCSRRRDDRLFGLAARAAQRRRLWRAARS